MIENKTINELIGCVEAYQMPDKLTEKLQDKEMRERMFDEFLKIETDLSFDWFTSYYQDEHGDRDKLKQDFTPDCLLTLMSGLMEDSDAYADICSGTGGLTIKYWSLKPDSFYYCEEYSSRAIPVLLFNLAIRGVTGRIVHGDSLTREVFNVYHLTKNGKYSDIQTNKENNPMKFDQVIMNPPYSMPWEPPKNDERFNFFGVPPKSKSDLAFVLHGLHKLNECGKLLAILPHGVLFRGSSEGTIRETLIKENLFDSVIGLPNNLFLNTGIPVAIIGLKKGKTDKNTIFIDASSEYKKDGKQNFMLPEHIERVLDTYKNRRFINLYAYVASADDFEKNDYNLNIPRYVDTFIYEAPPDLADTLNEIVGIELEIRETEMKLSEMVSELLGFTSRETDAINNWKMTIKGKNEHAMEIGENRGSGDSRESGSEEAV